MTWIVDGQPWESDTRPVTQVRPAKMKRLVAAGFDGAGGRSPFHPGEEVWLIAEGAVYRCNVCDVILPFRNDGSRGTRARKMEVSVLLQEDDTYSVAVYDLTNLNQHYSRDDVYAHELPRLMLALDWDGDEVLNPRYA